MKLSLKTLGHLACATALLLTASVATGRDAAAETLKWAHVYETSTPYHNWALWAAGEIKKQTDGRYEVEVYPAA